MKLALPGRDIKIDDDVGINPFWYDKLKLLETMVNLGAIGQGALATTATTGFGYIPITTGGPPTGVPVGTPTGYAPIVFDAVAHRLWIYDTNANVWRGVTLT